MAIEHVGNRLIGRYRTRKYEVYRTNESGSFSETLTTEIGPKIDGFTFEAQIVEEGKDYFHYDYGPYWTEYTQVFPTTEKGKLILVRKRYGRGCKGELKSQIDQAFGIDFINP